MKNYELKPTNENVLETLDKDIIGRNEYLRAIVELIDSITESTSISLNGDWGTGKTFLVRQLVEILNYCNTNITDENSKQIGEILEKNSILKEIKTENNKERVTRFFNI